MLLCTRNKDTHKVMFGIVAVDCNDILTLNTPSKPPGHAYKLHVYKPQCTSGMLVVIFSVTESLIYGTLLCLNLFTLQVLFHSKDL